VTPVNAINKEYFTLRKKQSPQAGIVPVPTPPDEEQRLKELDRLGILDKDFESDRRFESVRVRHIFKAVRPLLIRYTHLRIVYGFNKQLLTTSTINIAVKQTT
jgi:hypothetical protein